jgi:hypothetical protein
MTAVTRRAAVNDAPRIEAPSPRRLEDEQASSGFRTFPETFPQFLAHGLVISVLRLTFAEITYLRDSAAWVFDQPHLYLVLWTQHAQGIARGARACLCGSLDNNHV